MIRLSNYGKILFSTVLITLSASSIAYAGVISSVLIRVDNRANPGEELPDVTISTTDDADADEGEVVVAAGYEHYSIYEWEWSTSTTREMTIGYEPILIVHLEPAESDRYFSGSYKSSNVSIRGGEYVSAYRRSDDHLEVKLRLDPIEGTFYPPEYVEWGNHLGRAEWEAPDENGSGKYEVSLRRGGSTVYTTTTTSTHYDLHPYMTRTGDYTFRVRTIGESSAEIEYGTKSEWIESSETYVSEEETGSGHPSSSESTVFPGNSGPSGVGNVAVGWQLYNGYWYYIYPNGTSYSNGWLDVAGKWYYFNSEGKMQTGWQLINNNMYYLNTSGDMYLGWIYIGNRWYYLNPNQGENFGVLLKNTALTIGDKWYYLSADGTMVEGWYEVNGNWHYFYPGDGHMAVNTTINGFVVDGSGVWRR